MGKPQLAAKGRYKALAPAGASLLFHALLIAVLNGTSSFDFTVGNETRFDLLWFQTGDIVLPPPTSAPAAAAVAVPDTTGADRDARHDVDAPPPPGPAVEPAPVDETSDVMALALPPASAPGSVAAEQRGTKKQLSQKCLTKIAALHTAPPRTSPSVKVTVRGARAAASPKPAVSRGATHAIGAPSRSLPQMAATPTAAAQRSAASAPMTTLPTTSPAPQQIRALFPQPSARQTPDPAQPATTAVLAAATAQSAAGAAPPNGHQASAPRSPLVPAAQSLTVVTIAQNPQLIAAQSSGRLVVSTHEHPLPLLSSPSKGEGRNVAPAQTRRDTASALPYTTSPPTHSASAQRHIASASSHTASAPPHTASAPPHTASASPHTASAPPHTAPAPPHTAPAPTHAAQTSLRSAAASAVAPASASTPAPSATAPPVPAVAGKASGTEKHDSSTKSATPQGIVLSSLHGDLKMVMTGDPAIRLLVSFGTQRKSEGRNQKRVQPVFAKSGNQAREAVVGSARAGVYTFIAEPEHAAPTKGRFTLKLYEAGAREKTVQLGSRTISGRTVLARVLMPEGILWDDDSAFSGSLEDSDSTIKYNTQTGLYWKEFKD